jgi:hypothetical protein
MRKHNAIIFALSSFVFLLIPGIVPAATWFSCNGDSFCGSSISNYWGTVDLVSDSSSPSGSSKVWRWTYPNGMPGGEGVGNVWPALSMPGGAQEMWVQWYWKYSPGFVYHGVVNKQFYFYPSNTMGMGIIPDTGVNMQPQGPNQANYFPNVNKSLSYVQSTGSWHKYKARFVMNSNGAFNGIYQAWVDDVMVSNYSNVYYGNGEAISSPAFVVIYGGMGGSVPQTQYFYMAGIYVGSTEPGGGSSVPAKTPMPPMEIRIN